MKVQDAAAMSRKKNSVHKNCLKAVGHLLLWLLVCTRSVYSEAANRQKQNNVIAEMQVLCHSNSIVLNMNTNLPFNGMIYPKDALNSNQCLSEYHSATNMTFRLPLKSCGTLFTELDDGVEFFNTIIVQPHMRLMTNQGKGYHVRCKYQTRERTIANTHFNVSAAFQMENGPQASTTPLLATASMPSCTMKIFRSGRDNVAEAVKIGDKLIMVIEIDQQDMYGMRVSNCFVRDGLNVAEQLLIKENGCPVDELIMPKFDYSNKFTRATVSFPAHKFPHTNSIYYQCNVRLCINSNGGCEPLDCSSKDLNSSATAPVNSSSILTTSSNNSSTTTTTTTTITTTSPSPYSDINLARSSTDGPNVSTSTALSNKEIELTQRRRRFLGVDSKFRAAPGGQLATELAPSVSPLPEASAFRSDASKQDVSFDVYSGLYVNDIDINDSPASIDRSLRDNSSHSSGTLFEPVRGRSSLFFSSLTGSLLLAGTGLTLGGLLVAIMFQAKMMRSERARISQPMGSRSQQTAHGYSPTSSISSSCSAASSFYGQPGASCAPCRIGAYISSAQGASTYSKSAAPANSLTSIPISYQGYRRSETRR